MTGRRPRGSFVVAATAKRPRGSSVVAARVTATKWIVRSRGDAAAGDRAASPSTRRRNIHVAPRGGAATRPRRRHCHPPRRLESSDPRPLGSRTTSTPLLHTRRLEGHGSPRRRRPGLDDAAARGARRSAADRLGARAAARLGRARAADRGERRGHGGRPRRRPRRVGGAARRRRRAAGRARGREPGPAQPALPDRVPAAAAREARGGAASRETAAAERGGLVLL